MNQASESPLIPTYLIKKRKDKWVILKPSGGCVNDLEFVSEELAVRYLGILQAYKFCK